MLMAHLLSRNLTSWSTWKFPLSLACVRLHFMNAGGHPFINYFKKVHEKYSFETLDCLKNIFIFLSHARLISYVTFLIHCPNVFFFLCYCWGVQDHFHCNLKLQVQLPAATKGKLVRQVQVKKERDFIQVPCDRGEWWTPVFKTISPSCSGPGFLKG